MRRIPTLYLCVACIMLGGATCLFAVLSMRTAEVTTVGDGISAIENGFVEEVEELEEVEHEVFDGEVTDVAVLNVEAGSPDVTPVDDMEIHDLDEDVAIPLLDVPAPLKSSVARRATIPAGMKRLDQSLGRVQLEFGAGIPLRVFLWNGSRIVSRLDIEGSGTMGNRVEGVADFLRMDTTSRICRLTFGANGSNSKSRYDILVESGVSVSTDIDPRFAEVEKTMNDARRRAEAQIAAAKAHPDAWVPLRESPPDTWRKSQRRQQKKLDLREADRLASVVCDGRLPPNSVGYQAAFDAVCTCSLITLMAAASPSDADLAVVARFVVRSYFSPNGRLANYSPFDVYEAREMAKWKAERIQGYRHHYDQIMEMSEDGTLYRESQKVGYDKLVDRLQESGGVRFSAILGEYGRIQRGASRTNFDFGRFLHDIETRLGKRNIAGKQAAGGGQEAKPDTAASLSEGTRVGRTGIQNFVPYSWIGEIIGRDGSAYRVKVIWATEDSPYKSFKEYSMLADEFTVRTRQSAIELFVP